jgi:hypothetical protein
MQVPRRAYSTEYDCLFFHARKSSKKGLLFIHLFDNELKAEEEAKAKH